MVKFVCWMYTQSNKWGAFALAGRGWCCFAVGTDSLKAALVCRVMLKKDAVNLFALPPLKDLELTSKCLFITNETFQNPKMRQESMSNLPKISNPEFSGCFFVKSPCSFKVLNLMEKMRHGSIWAVAFWHPDGPATIRESGLKSSHGRCFFFWI